MLKGLEDGASSLHGNPDSGVTDRNRREIVRVFIGFDADHDLTGLRELQRVPYQVHDYLLQLRRVCFDVVYRVRTFNPNLHVRLFAPNLPLHKGQRVVSELDHVDRQELQFHLSRFDFRQIEDLVDEREQVLPVHLNAFQETELRGRQVPLLVLQQDVGETDHGVERCTQLMAHVRQKMALGPIRCLRFVLGRNQVHLGRPTPRDVFSEDHDAGQVFMVPDRAEEQLEVPLLAIQLL